MARSRSSLRKSKASTSCFWIVRCPVSTALPALAELKRVHPDIKVIMITGTRDVRIEDRARAEGARDFLYKPFFAKDIDAALNRLLGLALP